MLFMLPTQAASAIVLEGLPIIIAGFIITAYYVSKNKSLMFDASSIKVTPTLDTHNTAVVNENIPENNVFDNKIENNTASHDTNNNVSFNNNQEYDDAIQNDEELLYNR